MVATTLHVTERIKMVPRTQKIELIQKRATATKESYLKRKRMTGLMMMLSMR